MSAAAEDLRAAAARSFARKRLVSFGIPAAIVAYLVYVFFAFQVPDLIRDADLDNGRALIADTASHKVHVERDNRDGTVEVSIEGERRGVYAEGQEPDWVTMGETTIIELEDGHVIRYLPDGSVEYDIPGIGTIAALPSRSEGVQVTWPDSLDPENLPDWISVSRNNLRIITDAGRLTVTRNRTEVFRYFFGWEMFWFTLDSPYHGLTTGEVLSRAADGEAGAIVAEVWNNSAWNHGLVFRAFAETILMAFLGTAGAAIVALPLAFLAAKNFTIAAPIRFVTRRFFDFVRGVDALIWTIVMVRAFGLGPMTGSLAILLTDTGSFGKLFSEALENVDNKQIEGVGSTGAKPLQRYRFGVIPQVMPVMLSQVLYFLESNTRSATIVGAITGGGFGPLIVNAIATQKDWEEVSYYILLIVLMVILMDWLSGWLRRRLIKGDESGH